MRNGRVSRSVSFLVSMHSGLVVARWMMGLLLFGVVQSAWATSAAVAGGVPTLGQIGTYQQGTAQGLSSGLYYFLLFFGLLMVGVGIIMWGYSHKKHESPMVAIVIIVAGVLLASLPEVISVGSATVFTGSNESQVNTVLGGSSTSTGG